MKRILTKQLTSTIRRFKDEVVYAKAPKMSERKIWITVENPKGYRERLQGDIGKSLFETLKDKNVNVGGYCFGGDLYNLREKPVEPNALAPYCALCYVEIMPEWYQRLEIHPLEQEILEQEAIFGLNKYKRLSCCITLEPWMNEMIVRIPMDLPSEEADIIAP